ncbi:glycerophosphoryl diester phosphodiesterase [Algibacter lectus]|uniref:Glycerophosphoryl diester phosphodiesterase n=1 Tax=Algibacter lectus TaxID=221126 RepID=A0A090V8P8_9FLAO|nr:glycerophosphoryl diester phosphodiesterase [Algibacter lectus]
MNQLDFKPQIYGANFKLIENKTTVDSLRDLNIKLIPWTVNNEEDIKRMIELQVDGIITDYPERVLNLLD